MWDVYYAMETMHVEWFGSVDTDLFIFGGWLDYQMGSSLFPPFSFLVHYAFININGMYLGYVTMT